VWLAGWLAVSLAGWWLVADWWLAGGWLAEWMDGWMDAWLAVSPL